MAETGKARKVTDRRRVRAQHVVETPHNGSAQKTRGFRISRTAEFNTGSSSGKNGRA